MIGMELWLISLIRNKQHFFIGLRCPRITAWFEGISNGWKSGLIRFRVMAIDGRWNSVT
jgi:hypothetical protein